MAVNKLRMIDNYIYFYHLEKFCVLPMYPDSVTDSMQANFASTNSLARTSPVFTYSNSGPRTVTINLDLHRDMMNDLNRDISNLKLDGEVEDVNQEDYVDILINHLQSMALPRYKVYDSGSRSVIPPMVAVRFGDDIFIKGVVNSQVQCTFKKPILTLYGGKKKYAQVSISFTVYETDPYDADKVAKSGSFRGISATFKDGIYNYTYSSDNHNVETIVDEGRNNSNEKEVTQSTSGAPGGSTTHTSSSGRVHGGGGGRLVTSSSGGNNFQRKSVQVFMVE